MNWHTKTIMNLRSKLIDIHTSESLFVIAPPFSRVDLTKDMRF
jgi:hypothetical protein